jgi:hypothetical protein
LEAKVCDTGEGCVFQYYPPAPSDDDGRYFDVFLPPAGQLDSIKEPGRTKQVLARTTRTTRETYPHSQETVALLAKPLERADALRVFRDNAAELFHFDPEELSEPLPG